MRVNLLTYLLAVCPFSIAFLVFVNASISFVVTDLIGRTHGEGDAVGTLGFADELLALLACPVWGVLSDRIGVRMVCVSGYAIIAFSLLLLVEAKNVYPHLLLARLLFSIGGAAVSTMVTAVLPAVTGKSLLSTGQTQSQAQAYRVSVSSELTITPHRFLNRRRVNETERVRGGGGRGGGNDAAAPLAGFVGMFAGCGALVALTVFLPLPARFEKDGLSPAEAIRKSYHVVAIVALAVSLCCFVGLRNLPGEEHKGWRSLRSGISLHGGTGVAPSSSSSSLPYWKQLTTALGLGFRNPDIGLGYIGGFVARASSVGISLFIPLFVNHYYRVSGLCDESSGLVADTDAGLGDIKRSCPKAYILASILTGVSQLIALIAAPFFGFLSARSRRQYHAPLFFAAVAGIIGYIVFALLPSPQFKGPQGNGGVFVVMALLGISQIGAIVCSLAVLSRGILSVTSADHVDTTVQHGHTRQDIIDEEEEGEEGEEGEGRERRERGEDEEEPPFFPKQQQLSHLKGSIAGVYSLYGGAGILLLTKLGGLLFDVSSPGAPFYIMAAFNGLLLASSVAGFSTYYSLSRRPRWL
ncbi:hypothetical protein ASPZODRAFT_2045712 [Penicilliopsis zonata CBS 506.65]|uniref:Major facilitator superfamily (MFS) profile domain-containing protein n=1 Tax=Penicilliopsis zonata CBS 506.65 TaxID=1073090 RepID=A0A1L9SG11_9EURO|nr:hypothetical protein ASPZODRAFT_2045712 [Penicilliopsis zonata CBS 506.65]OJJ46063.1 hypothetical protein ASPZODRAFT_2045712 [Penicilliopsis zonata CBS 506.65]